MEPERCFAMAYPEIPAGFALVRHLFTSGEGTGHAYVLYGVELLGSPTANNVASELDGYYAATILPHQSADSIMVGTHVVQNLAGVLSEGDHTNGGTGGMAGVPVAPQIAVLIRKQTSLIGRKFRGRMYIPYAGGGNFPTNNGFMDSTHTAAWQADATTFLADIAGGTDVAQMVLLHRDHTVVPTQVNALTVESVVATQRRRNRKAPHH